MTTKVPPLPIKLRDCMESLLRAANEEGYVLIGSVFHENGSIALLTNAKDDPAGLLHAVGDMIGDKIQRGLIVNHNVLPLN